MLGRHRRWKINGNLFPIVMEGKLSSRLRGAPAVTRRRGKPCSCGYSSQRETLLLRLLVAEGNLAPAVTRRRGNLAPAVTRRKMQC
jgi:hypothetical protein